MSYGACVDQHPLVGVGGYLESLQTFRTCSRSEPEIEVFGDSHLVCGPEDGHPVRLSLRQF